MSARTTSLDTRLAYLGSLLALPLLGPAGVGAQDTLQLRTNYYAVTGASVLEIRRSVERARPGSGAEPHDGLTVWQINWKTAIHQRDGVNRLSAFTTRTTISVTLPRWTAPTNAAPELVKAWNDYSAALHEHEQGHVQLVRATLAELHTCARAVPPGADAQALRQQVEELARGIVATGTRRHGDYDHLTQHGATQGARLPTGPRPKRAAPGTSAAEAVE